MQLSLQISLHGIEHSDALYEAIRAKAEKLDRYYDRIMSCSEIAITRAHDEDLQVALRDAFGAAT